MPWAQVFDLSCENELNALEFFGKYYDTSLYSLLQKLVVTIFDNGLKNSYANWDAMCEAVKKFPRDLVTMEYKAGALATGVKIEQYSWFF